MGLALRDFFLIQGILGQLLLCENQLFSISPELSISHSDVIAPLTLLAGTHSWSPHGLSWKPHPDCIPFLNGWQILGIAIVLLFGPLFE